MPGLGTFHRNFQSSVEHTKISRLLPFYIVICFIVLCITPPNFRPLVEIFKELEAAMSFRMDRWPSRCMEWPQYPSVPMAAKDNNCKYMSMFLKVSSPHQGLWYKLQNRHTKLNCSDLQISVQFSAVAPMHMQLYQLLLTTVWISYGHHYLQWVFNIKRYFQPISISRCYFTWIENPIVETR